MIFIATLGKVHGSTHGYVYGLCLAFDLSKAFDTVQRDLLFVFSSNFVNILCQFQDRMTSRVTVEGQESAPFCVRAGVCGRGVY